MPPPELPAIGNLAPGLVEVMRFPCNVDHAVVGLMDPAHGPFVHRSWWWRSRASIHDKAKPFGPSDYGFTMRRHAPSTNSRAYRILGGTPQTEISFRLPGIRIEHVQTGKHHLINLTAVTPVSETETEITHCIYWTIPWLSLLRPLIRRFAKAFLNQDRHIVTLQQRGLKYNPSLMLIKDADTQARWYYQLKVEFTRAEAEGRAFENPVREQVLRWRS
jgi:phenylpropionate dioxygenase-like ring-hydroxylating dioxygenase large terminal subunit